MSDDMVADLREREVGRVRLVVDGEPAAGFDDIAAAAGLMPLGAGWMPVDAARAEQILARLLQRSLAHEIEIRPESEARRLAHAFLAAVADPATRYATNTTDLPGAAGAWSFTPAADGTVDCGILVLAPTRSACVWVIEDD